MLRLSDFDYALPESAIAQNPAEPRDSSKLLVVAGGEPSDHVFSDLPQLLSPGDLLVLNNTRVTARRLMGERESGGKVQALLLHNSEPHVYEALVKPAKRVKNGTSIWFAEGLSATVIDEAEGGMRTLRFQPSANLTKSIDQIGSVPLPPYIHSTNADDERYQTVYAKAPGSSAAPTAGLHFTPELLAKLGERGVCTAFVTLDVGVDTFRPVQSENFEEHKMHGERYFIPVETRDAVASATGRIVAVGTTTVRALETASLDCRLIRAGDGCSSLFIKPGYPFRTVDAMLTNFHMPRTTMLLMVAALCGKETLMRAYQHALINDYRFLSFGDSMLILTPSKGENHA